VLSVKKSEYLSHPRALLTEGAVRQWFSNVRQQLNDEGVDLEVLNDPSRIFNLDETAIFTNPNGKERVSISCTIPTYLLRCYYVHPTYGGVLK